MSGSNDDEHIASIRKLRRDKGWYRPIANLTTTAAPRACRS